jgi:type IV secretory pathway VirB2 component (pilin)
VIVFRVLFNHQLEQLFGKEECMFQSINRIFALRCLLLMVICMFVVSMPSFASTGASGLPWETPLQTVTNSLTGPVALAISVAALFACGAALVFGGEMSEFVKRALYAVMAIAFIVGGSAFISKVFNFTGALI